MGAIKNFLFLSILNVSIPFWNTPATVPTIFDVIRSNEYSCEIHTVTSRDGYILQLHRILRCKNGTTKGRPAVLLVHGILSSSADWLIASPNKSLSYILTDAGYDVWLGNQRGNRYSRRHLTLDPDKDARVFWDFTWHQMGIDDIPSMIDYIIKTVKQPQIFYIGHSQGTTVFFVMCSERPEYNKKIRGCFSLAPVAWIAHIKSPIMRQIAKVDEYIESILNAIGLYEFLPNKKFLALYGEKLCGQDSVLQPLCTNALFMIYGFSRRQLNTTLIPIAMHYTPAGASSKQLLHYAQLVNSGHFRQWDYGEVDNQKHYESDEPPDYRLENVVAPVYLYHSSNDWLSSPIDVALLSKKLRNVRRIYKVPDKNFNHIDFIFGIDAHNLLYKQILYDMKRARN